MLNCKIVPINLRKILADFPTTIVFERKPVARPEAVPIMLPAR